MFKKNVPPPPSLSARQITAVTGCVPMTGDDTLDFIITTSMRLRIAADFMGHMLASDYYKTYEIAARESLKAADELVKQFQVGAANGQA